MKAAHATIPASLPNPGLDGLKPQWSRVVEIEDALKIKRQFHVLDTGIADGQIGTLLCVHGNPTWSYLWRKLLGAPPVGWRVVAVDQLGMGWSQRIGQIRRLADRIDDLNRLSIALSIDGPVVTVAHDWGGPVSLGWALAHPGQLAGIILTNTAVHQPEGARAPAVIRIARTPGVLAAFCRTTAGFVRATTAISSPRPPRAVRDAFAAPYDSPARRQGVADFVVDIPLEEDHPSMPILRAVAEGIRELAVPVLLAWGPADPVFSDLYLRDLIERLPQADVHRYEGASHLVTEDAPRAIDDIRSWVQRLSLPTDDKNPAQPVKNSDLRQGCDSAAASEPTVRRHMGAFLSERGGDPRTADQAAIIEMGGSGRTISWRQFDSAVRDLSAGLSLAGVNHGDRVALLIPPGGDLAAAVYACWRIGAVIVIADAGLGARGLARALRGAWPDHIIAVDRGLIAARALRVGGRRFAANAISSRRARLLGAEQTLVSLAASGRGWSVPRFLELPGPDDDAAVVFTSGATGPAKGVVYRHCQIEANRDALIELYAVTEADALVAAFAPFALYGPAMGIATAVPDMDVTRPATLDASHLADAVSDLEATLIWASPASLRHVLATSSQLNADQQLALRSVRLIMSAGAPVSAELLRGMCELLPNARVHTPYGMTEVLPVADIDLAERDSVGAGNGVCVGRAVRGADICISALDRSGQTMSPTTQIPFVTGEILVKAPWSKDRYDRLWATEESAARNTGWHRTGDVGHLDSESRLWVEGRLAHVITTAGGIVTPVGVEQRVEALDEIVAAACVGVGPVGTQVVVVVIVPRQKVRRDGDLAEADLTAKVRVAAGIDVAAVIVRSTLPVDIRHNSKVDRAALGTWAQKLLS